MKKLNSKKIQMFKGYIFEENPVFALNYLYFIEIK